MCTTARMRRPALREEIGSAEPRKRAKCGPEVTRSSSSSSTATTTTSRVGSVSRVSLSAVGAVGDDDDTGSRIGHCYQAVIPAYRPPGPLESTAEAHAEPVAVEHLECEISTARKTSAM